MSVFFLCIAGSLYPVHDQFLTWIRLHKGTATETLMTRRFSSSTRKRNISNVTYATKSCTRDLAWPYTVCRYETQLNWLLIPLTGKIWTTGVSWNTIKILFQVHKETIDGVPNAIPGRTDIELEIYGMEGIPERDMQERRRLLEQKAQGRKWGQFNPHKYKMIKMNHKPTPSLGLIYQSSMFVYLFSWKKVFENDSYKFMRI